MRTFCNTRVVLPTLLVVLIPTALFAQTAAYLESTQTFSGSNSFKTINSVRYADQFPGADIGAKINAAIGDLPATGGTIVVLPQSSTITTQIVINRPNVELIGIGRPELIELTTGFNIISVQGYTPNPVVRGFRFTGPKIANPAGYNGGVMDVDIDATGGGGKFTDNIVDGTNGGFSNFANNFPDFEVSFSTFSNLLCDFSSCHDSAIGTANPRMRVLFNFFNNVHRHEIYFSGNNTNDGGASNSMAIGNRSYGHVGLEAVALYATNSEFPLRGIQVRDYTWENSDGQLIGFDNNVDGAQVSGIVISSPTATLADATALININGVGSVSQIPYNPRNIVVDGVTITGFAVGDAFIARILDGNNNIIRHIKGRNANTYGIHVTYDAAGVNSTGNIIEDNELVGTAFPYIDDSGNIDTIWRNNISDTAQGGLARLSTRYQYIGNRIIGTTPEYAVNTASMAFITNQLTIGSLFTGATGAALHINGQTPFNDLVLDSGILRVNRDGSQIYHEDGSGSIRNIIGTDSNGYYIRDNFTTGFEVFRIKAGGNVGVGTTSPSEKLEVNGNIKVDGFAAINGAKFYGAQTHAQLKTLSCPVLPCVALSSDSSYHIYFATGTSGGAWKAEDGSAP